MFEYFLAALCNIHLCGRFNEKMAMIDDVQGVPFLCDMQQTFILLVTNFRKFFKYLKRLTFVEKIAIFQNVCFKCLKMYVCPV